MVGGEKTLAGLAGGREEEVSRGGGGVGGGGSDGRRVDGGKRMVEREGTTEG